MKFVLMHLPFCLSVAYSSNEELRTSACDFWCAILSSKNEVNLIFVLLLRRNVEFMTFYTEFILVIYSNQVDLQHVKIDWFPSYSELKLALENYGFLFNSSTMEYVHSSKFSYLHSVFMTGFLFHR